MIEEIRNNGVVYAIIIRTGFNKKGIHFFTDDTFSQQLGYMNREKGYIIQPHRHNIVERKVTLTQEVLFIKSGIVLANFYDEKEVFLEKRILDKGDVILLANGGHGFEILEDAEIRF
jgi:hypothetical protein